MKLTLPFPPSVNRLYRSIPRGKICTTILSKEGREYRALVRSTVTAPETLRGRVRCVVWLNPPDRRRRDILNYTKILMDVLQVKDGVGAIEDDEQIDYVTVVRGPVVRGGNVMVEIYEREDEDDVVLA